MNAAATPRPRAGPQSGCFFYLVTGSLIGIARGKKGRPAKGRTAAKLPPDGIWGIPRRFEMQVFSPAFRLIQVLHGGDFMEGSSQR